MFPSSHCSPEDSNKFPSPQKLSHHVHLNVLFLDDQSFGFTTGSGFGAGSGVSSGSGITTILFHTQRQEAEYLSLFVVPSPSSHAVPIKSLSNHKQLSLQSIIPSLSSSDSDGTVAEHHQSH